MSDRPPLAHAEGKRGLPAPIESTVPWTIRVMPRTKDRLAESAARRGEDAAEYARQCLIIGDSVLSVLTEREAYIRVPA